MPPRPRGKNTPENSENTSDLEIPENGKDEKSEIAKMFSLLKDMRDRQIKIEGKMDFLTESVSNLENFKADVETKIIKLNSAIDDKEQHSRNFSIRIFGFKLSEEAQRNPVQTAKEVYNDIIFPILSIANLPREPDVFEVIEYCHPLPAKNGTGPAPVLVRFTTRLYRNLVFVHKKSFFASYIGEKVSIVEDLTRANFQELRKLQNDESVNKAWSMMGKIRYTLKSNPNKVILHKKDNPLTA